MFNSSGYNPDVLSCIANLSSDEVFTPPQLVNRILDLLPEALWSDRKATFLDPGCKQAIKFHGSQRISWIKRSDIQLNPEWIDQWKVLMTRVQGTSAAVETMFLSRPIIAGPGDACSETYLVAGRFDSKPQAERYAAYLRTRFVRFLVSLRKATQDAAKDVYAFVPDLPLNREWTDEKLYERYGLTEEEIAFIESLVRPMPADDDKAGGEASDE